MDHMPKEKAAAFMGEIEKEFSKLRRLAFVGGMFFLPVFNQVEAAGHSSKAIFPALTMAADLKSGRLPWWLTVVADLKRQLRKAEIDQLEQVSKASIRGLVTAIVIFISLMVALVWHVGTSGGGHPYTVPAMAAAFILWIPVNLLLTEKVGNEIEQIDDRIQSLVRDLGGPLPE
jgi:hypothetical protein|nr:hypothetical protein [Neorhizobium tomejilense]